MKDLYVVNCCRTAIGSFGGSLKNTPAAEMGAVVVKEALKRANIAPENVDEVMFGCILTAAQGQNVARQVAIKAGIPYSVPAYTVGMVCGSGMKSVIEGARSILAGDSDVVVCGGTENMSAAPFASMDARWGARMGDKKLVDTMIKDGLWDAYNNYHMGTTAENINDIWGITREEQDAFAAQSQQRACKAIAEGVYKDEIVPVEIKGRKGAVTVFDTDENPREGVTAESLARLKPCFVTDGTGTVTAANSSSLNDAAAAVVIMTRAKAEELGCTPMVCIRDFAVAGYEASLMGYSPYFSSKKLAEKLGIDLTDIDFFEINEAFASQAFAVSRDLGLDPEKVNIYGGGISIGHPIGATGTILAIKCAYELAQRHPEKQDAMVSMCIGGGQGISMYFTKE